MSLTAGDFRTLTARATERNWHSLPNTDDTALDTLTTVRNKTDFH